MHGEAEGGIGYYSSGTTYSKTYISDATVHTLSIPLSISEPNIPEVIELNMNVFPNPTNAQFNVQLDEQVTGTAVLTDLQGRAVWRKSIMSDVINIDAHSLPSGIYHISVTTDTGHTATKTITLIK